MGQMEKASRRQGWVSWREGTVVQKDGNGFWTPSENKGDGDKSVRAALFTRVVSAVRGVQGWALQVLGQK